MNLRWRERANADLNEVFGYLIEQDPAAALRIRRLIRERVGLLAEYPNLGRPGRATGTRELVISQTPYVVVYTIDPDIEAVVILRVLHGAREWPEQP